MKKKERFGTGEGHTVLDKDNLAAHERYVLAHSGKGVQLPLMTSPDSSRVIPVGASWEGPDGAASASDGAGWTSEPVGRTLEPAGRASEPAGRASEPAGRASQPAGRALEPARRASLGASRGDGEIKDKKFPVYSDTIRLFWDHFKLPSRDRSQLVLEPCNYG